MKKSFHCLRFSKCSGGFTLVELLVVIAIIAILAGVLLGALGTALRAAQRAKAGNVATSIQTAALGYYTEYSVYPIPSGVATDYIIGDTSGGSDTAGIGDAAAWRILICALSGNVSPVDGTPVAATTIANSRGVTFLSLKASDLEAATVAPLNPLPYGTGGTATKYFNIAMDGDYSGVLGDAVSAVTGRLPNFTTSTVGNILPGGTSTAGVAVWANCNGAAATAASLNPNFYVHTY